MKLAAHLILFQLGWFSCVLGAAWGIPLAGPLVVAALAVAHMRFMPVAGDVRRIVAAGVLGLLVDSALAASGLVAYAGTPGPRPSWLAPPWIVAMWANFALALPRSLAWLRPRSLLAALLGAVLGPSAYMAGEALGAVQLVEWPGALVLAFVWAVVLSRLIAFV